MKKGNMEVMKIFGFTNIDCVNVIGFALGAEFVSIGENMTFSFKIETKKSIKVRLEYSIDYVKASGKRNRKIFQISEIYLKENVKKFYVKRHCFADISTRITGTHSISLIVNGTTWDTLILRCWLLNSLINYLINLHINLIRITKLEN